MQKSKTGLLIEYAGRSLTVAALKEGRVAIYAGRSLTVAALKEGVRLSALAKWSTLSRLSRPLLFQKTSKDRAQAEKFVEVERLA